MHKVVVRCVKCSPWAPDFMVLICTWPASQPEHKDKPGLYVVVQHIAKVARDSVPAVEEFCNGDAAEESDGTRLDDSLTPTSQQPSPSSKSAAQGC